ncbi:L,D-transpeptidase family protein [Streptomyces sp. NPDC056061]|uniref:L,D-transpeptidase family protein n=1 Tax=Streptomyces sp. NPDC056061 TaxID=3345700 RepID=UPI0035D8FE57
MSRNKQLVLGSLAAAALMTAVLLPSVTPPAQAAAAATTLVFDKNPQNHTRSKLDVYKGGVLRATFRAGSGLGEADDCAVGRGWMPNGNWRIELKDRHYDGRLIKGHAIWLENMRCSAKTATRTEMFIHSEMNRDGSQGKTEARRWDGDSDYRSNGCVKLNPTDIAKMFRLLDRIGWPTHLRVVD